MPNKPAFVKYASNPPRVIIDKDNLNTGSNASGNPPGYDPQGYWKYRGHLVALVLGGLGGAGSGNIVAMTHEANAKRMPRIENNVRDDVNAGAVYEYTVIPDYDLAKQKPPIRINVWAKRLYPDATKPDKVPKDSPYEVDNT